MVDIHIYFVLMCR